MFKVTDKRPVLSENLAYKAVFTLVYTRKKGFDNLSG